MKNDPAIPEHLRLQCSSPKSPGEGFAANSSVVFGISPVDDLDLRDLSGAAVRFPVWIEPGEDNEMVLRKVEALLEEYVFVYFNGTMLSELKFKILPQLFSRKHPMHLFDINSSLAKWYWVYIMEKEIPIEPLRGNDEF